MTLRRSAAVCVLLLATILCPTVVASEDSGGPSGFREFLNDHDIEYHGFYEARAGSRLQNDPAQKDISIMEARYQFDFFSMRDWGDVVVKGDLYGDVVTEEGVLDMREVNVFMRPLDTMDLKFGRQILTWGTGDLIFINDLFPKDWQSFFIGRDTEYLKAPSDAIKTSFFWDAVNLDLVYTPVFDSDRFISGERISYWDPMTGSYAGQGNKLSTERRQEGFQEDELALRAYRNIGSYELALYGYWGYWKSPGGFNAAMTDAIHPELNVYGASLRGQVGKGIGNVELGYYDSTDDRDGDDPLVNNSEMRYLVGYKQEIGRDFTAGLQYYIEQMLDYEDYENALPPGMAARDEFRHLTALRLTKLLMNQNLMLSLFTYYSPSDQDVYMRPIVNYKASDNLALEVGSNIFFGDDDHTFFNQFHHNANAYMSVRYSF